MAWVFGLVLGIAFVAGLMTVVHCSSYDAGHESASSDVRNEMTFDHRQEMKKLKQRHESELIDLRRRCINYAVALREADIRAGKSPFQSTSFQADFGAIPLRVENHTERKDS